MFEEDTCEAAYSDGIHLPECRTARGCPAAQSAAQPAAHGTGRQRWQSGPHAAADDEAAAAEGAADDARDAGETGGCCPPVSGGPEGPAGPAEAGREPDRRG